MDQSKAIARFLTQHDMCDVRCRESPMRDAAELFSDSEPVLAEVASWCKSVIGCLYFFVRASRWDVQPCNPYTKELLLIIINNNKCTCI